MKRSGVIFLAVLWFLSGVPLAATGYEEVEVRNGATLTGVVTLKGSLPNPRVFLLSRSPFGEFCKRISDGKGKILLREFIAGTTGGLQDTIVSVQQVKAGKSFPPIQAEFLATDCMFHPAGMPADMMKDDAGGHIHPLVTVIQNHQSISVSNRDPVFHNAQVFQAERGNIMLNFPLPVGGEPHGGALHFDPGKRISQMICGVHEFMQTWSLMVDNPYYDRTLRDGNFRIEQLPPGTYQVTAWHPHLKPIEKEITVTPDSVVSLDFEFDATRVKRRTFETEEGLRSLN